MPASLLKPRRLAWGAIVVVLAGAALGATHGWSAVEPVYRARGLIYIRPNLASPTDPGSGHMLPLFDAFVAFQVEVLRSPRCAELAIETEPWKQAGGGRDAAAAAEFEARCSAARQRRSTHIGLHFDHPVAETALAGVRAWLRAYEQLTAELSDGEKHLEHARTQIKRLDEELKTASTEEREELEAKREQLIELRERLQSQLVGKGRIRIVDRGTLPREPYRDARLASAARHAALGALPGFLALLVLGLALSGRRGAGAS